MSTTAQPPAEVPAATSGAAPVVVGTEDHGPHEPPALTAQAVKPALKKHPQIVPNGSSALSAGEYADDEGEEECPEAKKKKALKWDEHAIEEHDLLRGTRMKIDEPNTPYAHYDHHEDDGDPSAKRHPRTPPSEDQAHGQNLDHGVLERKLAGIAAARDFYPSSPSASSRDGGVGSSHSDDDEAARARAARQHEREFKMHRKQHYNEMEALKKFRAEHPGGLLDGEEEEDGGDDGDDMEL